MKKKTRKEKRQEQKVSNKENEKRLNIINSSYKCTVCGAWIKYQSRKKHLRIKHNLFPEDIKSFFLNKKAVREQKKEEILQKS
ncbi:MAG: hypothetical protein K2M03_05720 [Muribaculaceae bacterium]|nr:hypothetical protein [Muribaculaceae bacterium]